MHAKRRERVANRNSLGRTKLEPTRRAATHEKPIELVTSTRVTARASNGSLHHSGSTPSVRAVAEVSTVDGCGLLPNTVSTSGTVKPCQ